MSSFLWEWVERKIISRLSQENPVRRATALHEGAHVVIGHVFGMRFAMAELRDDQTGCALPESSLCATCSAYYDQHDPSQDEHARRIQDDFRRAAAVAVAGEVAEEVLELPKSSDTELETDRARARERASAIHRWTNYSCDPNGQCSRCDGVLDHVRKAVHIVLVEDVVRQGIDAIADALIEQGRLSGDYVKDLLEEKGLAFASRPVEMLRE